MQLTNIDKPLIFIHSSTHIHTQSSTHPHSLSHTHPHSLSHIHPHSLNHTHPHSLSHTHPHSVTYIHSWNSLTMIQGSEDRSIRVWTTKTKRCDCIGILTGHEKYISCLLIEEVYVVSGSADNSIRKWDMAICECMLIFRGHTGQLQKLITWIIYLLLLIVN